MKTTHFLLPLILLLTLMGGAAFSRIRRTPGPLVTATPAVRPVGPVRLHRLQAPQAGRVWEVYARPGDRVRPGQLVAKLAVPLESAEKQRRTAASTQAKQRYAHLLAGPAQARDLARARQEVVAAGQAVVATPALYTFVFVEAPTGGTLSGPALHAGKYLADSSTVAIIAEPVPAPLAATTPE